METGSSSYVRRARLSIECLPRGWRTEDDTDWSKRWPSALVFRAYPASSLSRRANKLPEPRARCLKPRCSNGLRARWRRAAGIILLTLLAATHEPFKGSLELRY